MKLTFFKPKINECFLKVLKIHIVDANIVFITLDASKKWLFVRANFSIIL
jgi:hypothetical protein